MVEVLPGGGLAWPTVQCVLLQACAASLGGAWCEYPASSEGTSLRRVRRGGRLERARGGEQRSCCNNVRDRVGGAASWLRGRGAPWLRPGAAQVGPRHKGGEDAPGSQGGRRMCTWLRRSGGYGRPSQLCCCGVDDAVVVVACSNTRSQARSAPSWPRVAGLGCADVMAVAGNASTTCMPGAAKRKGHQARNADPGRACVQLPWFFLPCCPPAATAMAPGQNPHAVEPCFQC